MKEVLISDYDPLSPFDGSAKIVIDCPHRTLKPTDCTNSLLSYLVSLVNGAETSVFLCRLANDTAFCGVWFNAITCFLREGY